jgi:hypothetical protein
MKYLLLILAVSLAGCIDPMGRTTREHIRADSAVAIAQADERARIAVAEAESHAIIAKHSIWADTLPFVVLIIGAFAVGALWLNWRGRYALKALEIAPQTPTAAQKPAMPTLGQLHRLAAKQGYTLRIDGDVAYLMAGKEIKGRLMLEG